VLDGEANLVEDQAAAAVDCLADKDREWSWRVGAALVADGSRRLTVRTSETPFRRDIAVTALALHNQLSHAVRHLRIVTPDLVVRLDRARLPEASPVTSPGDLAEASGLERSAFGPPRDAGEAALRCSAVAI